MEKELDMASLSAIFQGATEALRAYESAKGQVSEAEEERLRLIYEAEREAVRQHALMACGYRMEH